jgi:electron transfer flavoprotein beta subunit
MDPETKTLIREGIPSVINPLDKNALEAAFQVKEATGVEVVVVSMAPPLGAPLIKEALAMGADRGILVSDRAFAGSDTLATARILAAAIRKLEGGSLVLCGNASLDGSTAQVPSQLAECLGVPNVMHVCRLALEPDGRMLIDQKTETGVVRLEAWPPLVLSFTKEVNKPRLISFMGILEAESKSTAVWDNGALGVEPSRVGLAGSPTQMADLLVRQKTRSAQRLEGKPEEVARAVGERLYQLGIL